jgi:hypothetical protein
MTAIHTPIEKTKVYSAVTKTCRATVDRGLFRKQYNWVKVNDLDVLWPHNHVREAAIDAAKKFVEDMRKQGFSLLTAESDVEIYGPLRHHDFSKSTAHPGSRLLGRNQPTVLSGTDSQKKT